MRKENITRSDMIRGQNLFLVRNLFISRSTQFPHGALKIQPRDERDISHWSVKIVSGSKNTFRLLSLVREPSMEDAFSYLIFPWLQSLYFITFHRK